MVDDESCCMAEAVRAEPAAVAVARDHEQLGAFGGLNHLTFDPAGALDRGGIAAESSGGCIKQFARRSRSQCLDARTGVTLGVAASEQRTERAVRRRGNLFAGHVQQHDVCLRGRERTRSVDA